MHLAEIGFFREVRVKGYDSMLVRTLVAARRHLVRISTELSNQIRGLMKTFGLVVPGAKGGRFEAEVRRLLAGQDSLRHVIVPLLSFATTVLVFGVMTIRGMLLRKDKATHMSNLPLE